MNDDSDRGLAEAARRQLDRHAEAVDELTAARLAALRRRALLQATPRRLPRWLPAAAVAAAALLAVLLWMQPLLRTTAPGGGLELVASSEDLELIEDLEFYDWLEETQAGSS
ncbi:MAG TPA: hypothetical protein ENK05_06970 [Gammaproteobacteria bacterium]|nr:hypothetical protein [Gammaproteobacteria bacterium]